MKFAVFLGCVYTQIFIFHRESRKGFTVACILDSKMEKVMRSPKASGRAELEGKEMRL